jgi:hypothetical protein
MLSLRHFVKERGSVYRRGTGFEAGDEKMLGERLFRLSPGIL